MHICTKYASNHYIKTEEEDGLEGDTVALGKRKMSIVRDEEEQIILHRVRKS